MNLSAFLPARRPSSSLSAPAPSAHPLPNASRSLPRADGGRRIPLPTERDLPPVVELHARSRIGQALGELPTSYWLVVTHDDERFIAAFARGSECTDPEAEARMYLGRLTADHRDLTSARGYHLLNLSVWPDYLSLNDAGARFLNWGLLQLDRVGHAEILTRRRGGEIVTRALAAVLFPEPT